MSSLHQRSYSVEDYYSLEGGSTVRHEYLRGEIFAMAGGTVAHNQISANVVRALGNALMGKPCRVLGSDMRLLTPAGLITYPDVLVICGTVKLASRRQDVVTNPILLVEVLSEATRSYDLGEKFDLYKEIPTLREFLTLEQDRCHARSFVRTGSRWKASTFDAPNDAIPLASINVELNLMDAYYKVFDA